MQYGPKMTLGGGACVDLTFPVAGPRAARLHERLRSVGGLFRRQRVVPPAILRQARPWHDRPNADFGSAMFAPAHAGPAIAWRWRRRRGYGRPFGQYPPVEDRTRRQVGRNL